MGKGAATMVAGSRASGAAALVSHLLRARAAAARLAAGGHGRRVGAAAARPESRERFCYLPGVTFLSWKGDGIAGVDRRTNQNKYRTKKYPRIVLFSYRR